MFWIKQYYWGVHFIGMLYSVCLHMTQLCVCVHACVLAPFTVCTGMHISLERVNYCPQYWIKQKFIYCQNYRLKASITIFKCFIKAEYSCDESHSICWRPWEKFWTSLLGSRPTFRHRLWGTILCFCSSIASPYIF